MGRWDDHDFYFPRSVARQAKGGIRSQSKRGNFGESWWAKRWIAVLESFQIGARLQRGRSYARRGQVLSIAVEKSRVTAKVQGSRPDPYEITLEIKPLGPLHWKKIVQALSRQALYSSKLLAGEMPREIEQLFEKAGLSLFPRKSSDLKTECSCPDWSNPCKHIAAVYYLLGEEFDRDPFLIFRMRGMEREDILKHLSHNPAPSRTEGRPKANFTTEAGKVAAPPPEPLPAETSHFWGAKRSDEDLCGKVELPPVQAAHVKRLGKFPFWRGAVSLSDAVSDQYARASKRGLQVFLGTPPFQDPSE